MSLPYPSMNFTAFDILTAAEMNQMVANDQALADGTGFNSGAIGTSALSAGAVTPDKTDIPTKFFVYRNASQSVPGNLTSTKIQFDTELFDTGSNFDATTNHRFTAPNTGYYKVGGFVGANAASGSIIILDLRKNAGTFMRVAQVLTPGATSDTILSFPETIVSLTSGDYLELNAVASSTASVGLLSGASPIRVAFWGYQLTV